MIVLSGTGGRARSLEQESRVQKRGTIIPRSTGWPC